MSKHYEALVNNVSADMTCVKPPPNQSEIQEIIWEYVLPDKYSVEELKKFCYFFNHGLLQAGIGARGWAQIGSHSKNEILSIFIRRVLNWGCLRGVEDFLNCAKEDNSIREILERDNFSLVSCLYSEISNELNDKGAFSVFLYNTLLDIGIPKSVAFPYLLKKALSSRNTTSLWHENEDFADIMKEGFYDIFKNEEMCGEDYFIKLGLYKREVVVLAYECNVVFPKNDKLKPSNMEVRLPQNIGEMRVVLLTCWHNLPEEFIVAAAKMRSLAHLVKESELATDRQREEASKTLSKVNRIDGVESITHQKKVKCSYYTYRNIPCKNMSHTTYLSGWCGRCSGRPIPVRERIRKEPVYPFDMLALDESCENYIEGRDIFNPEILQAFAEIAYEGNTFGEDSFAESKNNKLLIKNPKNITRRINDLLELAKHCHKLNSYSSKTEGMHQLGISYFKDLPQFFQWNAIANSYSVKISNKGAWFETFNHAVIDWSLKLEDMKPEDIVVIPSSQEALIKEGGVLKMISPSYENEFKKSQPQEWEFLDENGEVDQQKSSHVSASLSNEHSTVEYIEAMMYGEWPENIHKFQTKLKNPINKVEELLPVDNEGRVMHGKIKEGTLTAFLPVREIYEMIKGTKATYEPVILLRTKSNGDIEFIKTERSKKKLGSLDIIGGIGNEPSLVEGNTRVGEFPSSHKEADLIRCRIYGGVGKPDNEETKGREGFDDLILLDAHKMLIAMKIAIRNEENYVSVANSSSLCYIDCAPNRGQGRIGLVFRSRKALTIAYRYTDAETMYRMPKESFALPPFLMGDK